MHDQLTHQLSADRTGRASCRAVACRPRSYHSNNCTVPRLERQIDAIRQLLMTRQKFVAEMLDDVIG
ncbi:hypothetical protein [Pantoea dispersa]|uniref:Uncharacterized protein n=1 Tax=Pantoea dispersa TaxID=59814 RepID=A0A8E1V5D2_9GAMM|nr:hypothetical protein [Pantoea dispersa]KTR88011.1 hypothetical protein SA2_21315 [Pantoea dispersa]KTS19954.1 hypothetical protein SA4R_20315 [Pantoea dispersa]KTS56736.1 hypothetical protein SA5R_19195 [Pantoea dispersa]KTS65269.1 hypothetical protein SA3R_21200 [Pantoea dispersa]